MWNIIIHFLSLSRVLQMYSGKKTTVSKQNFRQYCTIEISVKEIKKELRQENGEDTNSRAAEFLLHIDLWLKCTKNLHPTPFTF